MSNDKSNSVWTEEERKRLKWKAPHLGEFVVVYQETRDDYGKPHLETDKMKRVVLRLQDLDGQACINAVMKHKNPMMPPNPASIRLAVEGDADQLKDQGAQCWAKIRKAVCHAHTDKDVFFDDWRAMVALNGYWKSICIAGKTSYEALDSIKYDFIRAYVQAAPENAVSGFVESSMNETGQRRYLLCSEDTNNVPTLINEPGGMMIPQQRIDALLSHIEQVKLLEGK